MDAFVVRSPRATAPNTPARPIDSASTLLSTPVSTGSRDDIPQQKTPERGQKRALEVGDGDISQFRTHPSSPKRGKVEEVGSLTTDQKLMMERNRMQALARRERLENEKVRGLICRGLTDDGWVAALGPQILVEELGKVAGFLRGEARSGFTVFPPANLVFSALESTPLQNVKVVILGQDPYHGPNQAHGLSFSVSKPVAPPPSLKNIYQELASDIPGFVAPAHGFLGSWASQGVLLLNTTLTVRRGDASSHSGKWDVITDSILRAVGKSCDGVVFILWGRHAQAKRSLIESGMGNRRFEILTSPHPSPYSADRGFFGSKPFSKANALLKGYGRESVNWLLE